jgi:FkbM family methyltransferase
VLHTLRFILNHPFNRAERIRALLRFVRWQIGTRLNPYPVAFPFTENSKLLIWRGLVGATGNVYCGLHEFEDMGFLLHFLRRGDLFVDIGANVGSYTVLAAAETGVKTISIEPSPTTFEHLMRNIRLNGAEAQVEALNLALGAQTGQVRFTADLDTINHVVTETEASNAVEVAMDTLDNVLGENNPTLLKIDVEGFETEVLKGARKTLENPNLQAIIVELNGSGERYGYDEAKIHHRLLSLGFAPYKYEPFSRLLSPCLTYGQFNTIYLRDLPFAQARVKSATKVCVQGKYI